MLKNISCEYETKLKLKDLLNSTDDLTKTEHSSWNNLAGIWQGLPCALPIKRDNRKSYCYLLTSVLGLIYINCSDSIDRKQPEHQCSLVKILLIFSEGWKKSILNYIPGLDTFSTWHFYAIFWVDWTQSILHQNFVKVDVHVFIIDKGNAGNGYL